MNNPLLDSLSMEYQVNPSSWEYRELRDRILSFNTPYIGGQQKYFGMYLKAGKTLIGGIICWQGPTVFIDVMWVDDPFRGMGLGSKLLQAAEDEARKRKVESVILDTFDFQAEPFYLKNGYERMGVLEKYVNGHDRIYLRKYINKPKTVL